MESVRRLPWELSPPPAQRAEGEGAGGGHGAPARGPALLAWLRVQCAALDPRQRHVSHPRPALPDLLFLCCTSQSLPPLLLSPDCICLGLCVHSLGKTTPSHSQCGVDDMRLAWFGEVKLAAARSLVAEGRARAAAAFLAFGVPAGARADVWETALGLRAASAAAPPAAAAAQGLVGDAQLRSEFEALCRQVGTTRPARPCQCSLVAAIRRRDPPSRAPPNLGPARASYPAPWRQALSAPLLLDVAVSEDVARAVGDAPAFFLFEEAVRCGGGMGQ
jgi:hypothetical protein